MENIDLVYLDKMEHIKKNEFDKTLLDNQKYLKNIMENSIQYQDSLGWLDISEWAGETAISNIMEKAERVRRNADVFVLVGVGGSNQAARAVIKALQNDNGPEILYAGNNISAHYVRQLLKKLKDKSVYINVIAKNFETLEPGIGFRVLREYLEGRYGEEANKRITLTGTRGSRLDEIARDNGYDFLTFPDNIGGRYSVLSDVGLFPMAVAGIDIKLLAQGAKDMQSYLHECDPKENIALRYATYRNLLLEKGYDIEMMAFFEPQLHYFSKWWIQLFAESEGKDNKGIYPVSVNYSEDLHSVGQYVQDGQKIIFETFIDVIEQNESLILTKDHVDDKFDYLNDKDFWDINKAAFEATIYAHSDSGIPCLKITLPSLNEYYFGKMFYMFEFACYVSGSILGVNPFDQPGVENYKGYMFNKLGRSDESK
ncbi:glucose-6-phosphate isomerase [Mobilisporobacter senegalensis]|uniref:Glucose-6-phosphate isomerase n=1 Tax=Mobilisporobacter senegalensis TaxID=1329262 RepID=A0A3N1XEY8_9FIRM|nr:glucose-6-phosphate isomerase [Mobilisporobacter senegalensis]ROR25296.1 glucose-6-phosphate isomerase [Mobilisporobacter senegalensis]